MAIHYRTQGFVLKKDDLREADQLFTVYTKNFGKLRVLGRGIRKIKSKLRGHFQLFSLVELEFIQGKTSKTLTDALLINDFSGIKKNLRKLKIAYISSDVLDDLVRGQEPDEKIWFHLSDVFSKLNDYSADFNYSLLYYYFLWNFLSILGYAPELYHCIICSNKLKPEALCLKSSAGGVVCANCAKDQKKENVVNINPDTIKILRLILNKDWNVLKKLKIEKSISQNLKNASQNFLSYILSQTR